MNVNCNISEWLRLAEMDLSSAKLLIEVHKPTPIAIICFHSQQAAEKILKGYLFSHGVDAPKTHNLRASTELCGD